MSEHRLRVMSRRELLRGAAGAGATAAAPAGVFASQAGAATGTSTSQSANQQREAYETLTASESELLEAIIDQLIPADEHGPGAVEARVVHYIDRALGGALAGSLPAYRAGLAAMDRYARTAHGGPFVELSPADRHSVLVDVESGAAGKSDAGFTGSSTAFFNLVRAHTLQGMFGDPYYGGNANFVGWDLLRYPGVRTMVTPDDQRQLEANRLAPNHRSAYDYETFHKATVRAGSKGGAANAD